MTKPTPNPEHVAIVRQGCGAIDDWRHAHPLTPMQLENADLRGANLVGVTFPWQSNLRGADLSNTILTDCDFSNSDMTRVSLVGAMSDELTLLVGTTLREANLAAAHLLGANLGGCDLAHANLDKATFREAHFQGAILLDTTCGGADLTGARFGNTLIATDLTSAIGLESCQHTRSSTIAASVLLRPMARKWPLAFLRGCGLTDHEIHVVTSAGETPIQFFSAFISYSTRDDSFAVKLHDALQARGIRCWLDRHEVLPGDKIYDEVNKAVRLYDKVLLLCSRDSLTSWWVRNEVEEAIAKERRLGTQRGNEVLAIVPLDLDGHLFAPECSFPYQRMLLDRHAARFNDPTQFDAQLERLVQALRADKGARRPPPASKL